MTRLKKYFYTALVITALGLSTSCATLSSVSLTQIPKVRTNKVMADSSRWIFLGLNFDNDYVEKVTADLRSQCPNGKVTGILTKFMTRTYLILWKNTIQAQGYCIKGSKV